MIIFLDFDGTIVNISDRHYETYSQCTRTLGGAPISKNRYWKLKRRDTDWKIILPLSQLSVDVEGEFLARFINLIESTEMLAMDTLFDDSLNVLRSLSRQHELHLISLRRSHQNLQRQVDDLGLSSLFTGIYSGHSETKDGVLLKKAGIMRTVVGHANSVVVGDTEADIAAGQQLGIMSIAVTTGMRDHEYLSLLKPGYVVDSLTAAESILKSF